MTESVAGGRTIEDLPFFEVDDYIRDPVEVLNGLRPNAMALSARGVDVISYELTRQLLADHRLGMFGSHNYAAEGATPVIQSFIRYGVVPYMPVDAHLRVRRVFSKAFTLRRIDQSHDFIRMTAREVICKALDRSDGHLEFVTTIANHFPIRVLCELVGVPGDEIERFDDSLNKLHYLQHVPISEHATELETALSALYDYTRDLVDRRRQRPSQDFISALIEAESTEGKLETDELIWGIVNLLMAGSDTTKYQFTSAIHDLATYGVWDRVAASQDLIPGAVEEVERTRPMPNVLRRMTFEDVEVDGVKIPEGTEVRLNFFGCGRDPAQYEDPNRFDIGRARPIFPLIFGGGVHRCIGYALATAELNIGVEEVLSTINNVRIESAVPMPADMTFGGFESVEIAFTRR